MAGPQDYKYSAAEAIEGRRRGEFDVVMDKHNEGMHQQYADQVAEGRRAPDHSHFAELAKTFDTRNPDTGWNGPMSDAAARTYGVPPVRDPVNGQRWEANWLNALNSAKGRK